MRQTAGILGCFGLSALASVGVVIGVWRESSALGAVAATSGALLLGSLLWRTFRDERRDARRKERYEARLQASRTAGDQRRSRLWWTVWRPQRDGSIAREIVSTPGSKRPESDGARVTGPEIKKGHAMLGGEARTILAPAELTLGRYEALAMCDKGHRVAEGPAICPECGAGVIAACPSCGAPLRGPYRNPVTALVDPRVPGRCYRCRALLPWAERVLRDDLDRATRFIAERDPASWKDGLSEQDRSDLVAAVAAVQRDTPEAVEAAVRLDGLLARLGHDSQRFLDSLRFLAVERAKRVLFPGFESPPLRH